MAIYIVQLASTNNAGYKRVVFRQNFEVLLNISSHWSEVFQLRSRNVVNCFKAQSKVSLNLFTSIWILDPITLFLIASHVFSMKSYEAMYISDSSWWKLARMPAPRSFRWTSWKLFNVECNIFFWNINNLPCTCVVQKTLFCLGHYHHHHHRQHKCHESFTIPAHFISNIVISLKWHYMVLGKGEHWSITCC